MKSFITLTQQQFLIQGRLRATGRQYVTEAWLETQREPKPTPEQIAAQEHQAALDKLAKWNRAVGA